MKNYFLKRILNFGAILLAALFLFVSCKKDDDDNGDTPLVEDGIYLSGTATGYDGLDLKAAMEPGREEGAEFATLLRTGMYEKFIYLVAGELNIVEKAGATETKYGWATGTKGTKTLDGTNDQINGDVDTGMYVENGEAFTIASNGFYHVIMDETTETVYIAEVTSWGIIGDATDEGWSGEFDMTEVTLSATEGEWQLTELTLRESGGFKFRYNDGWKITTPDYIIFSNIGKAESSSDFIMGGGTFPYPTEGEGAYTVGLNWTPTDGFSYTTTRTGDVEPLPEYPDSLFMIGDGVGDWDWANTYLPMVPVHSKPNAFWKIQWIKATGAFKFSPERAWSGDFGCEDDTQTGLVDYKILVSEAKNVPVPGTEGYYLVYVDLEKDSISIASADVYLIGDVIGGWDTADPDGKFTVDNASSKITITKDLSAGDIRMYAWHKWMTDWWQSEFIVLSNKIEFRGREGDQERVNLSAGNYTVDLNFITGVGSIE